MPKIDRFKIKDFHAPAVDVYEVAVPQGAKFTNKVKILHDGIYAFFIVSEIILTDAVDYVRFKITGGRDPIPDNAELVDILDVVYEIPPEEQEKLRAAGTLNEAEPSQGMMLFSIFKIT